MRLAIRTPIVIRMPRSPEWEEHAGIAELAEIARAGDRLGYDHMTCPEHVGVPVPVTAVRGGTYWDPLATFGYLAACTQRIRFATNVLVLGYHHPLEIAKRYGTLDVVSGGRLILGLGVGSLREEFELLGAEFAERGARGDDALRALRASLSRREPAYRGTHYQYEGFVIDPCALQPRVPIWIGGRSLRSLRRALELGDGWGPFALKTADVGAMLARFERPASFEVIVEADRRMDPAAEPGQALDALDALARAGTTIAYAAVVHRSLAHYLEQLEALMRVNSQLAEGSDASRGKGPAARSEPEASEA
jgi:probable F420-dependent oxidoreductase